MQGCVNAPLGHQRHFTLIVPNGWKRHSRNLIQAVIDISAISHPGKNVANPTALLLSAVKMLSHVGLKDHAWILEHAVEDVLSKQKVSSGSQQK